MHFCVRIYQLVDEAEARPRFESNAPGRHPMELVRIGSVVIQTANRSRRPITTWRMAAAKAWVACVGIRRARTLKKLNAPAVIIAAQTDVRPVLESLHATSLYLPRAAWRKFLYDNGCESWIISLEPSPADLASFRCWAALDDDTPPAADDREFIELLTPSRN